MTRTSGTWARSVVLLIAVWSGSARPEVTLDGSLGGARGPLPGPDFEIGADFGRRVGSNLFHSFGAFNVSASESATFSGPNAIENVLGRVTGGSGSNIDGLLRSTIPDANLFLLNPAGIVFGPSATLDVQGSFHASTGDFIRLADGRRFDAVASANDALLTTNPPQAFGFLGRQDPAPIEVNGSLLRVPEGKALSLIGGGIQVHGAGLIAPAGRVNLASVGAKAEVTLGPNDLGVEPRSRGGAVTLSERSLIDTSGEGGGSVFIRGGEFVMDRSEVRSVSRSKNGGVVSIETKQLELQNGARIGTIAMGSGRAGDVLVEADRVSLSGDEAPSRTGLPGGIGSAAFGSGAAGTVAVKAKDLDVRKGAAISTLTRGSGRAGDVLVEADRVSLADRVPLPGNGSFPLSNLPGGIGSVAFDGGDAGTVTVKARDLQVRQGAAISTLTFGSGRAGNVLVEADRVSLSGDKSLSDNDLPGGIGSAASRSGAAGAVTVKAGDLEVRNRAVIGTITRSGRGGNVRVEADRVSLSGDLSGGDSRFFPTGIFAVAVGQTAVRRAGNVTVKTGDLKVRHGARIVTTTDADSGRGGNVLVEADRVSLSGVQSRFLPGGIGSVAFGNGASGTVTVKAGDLEVRNRAVIGSTTAGSGRGGDVLVEADRVFLSGDGAPDTGIGVLPLPLGFDPRVKGNVTIKAGELQVHNGAGIGSTTIDSARGGNIFVEADSVLLSGDGSPFVTGIFARAEGRAPGSGGGGDLTVNAGSLMVKEGATISASTFGPGEGGKLSITAADIELRDGASITSESISDSPNAGRSGEIFIQATDSFRLFNDSEVSVETQQADAGDITLDVGSLLHLHEQSSITTSVAPGTDGKGTGRGGDINIIDPVFTVLDGGSRIIANALEGSAGNIRIRTDFLFRSPDSEIEASNRRRVQGNVEIDSPETDLNAGLVPLPASFFDAAQVLMRPCAERSGADVIRLVVRPYEVLPDSPYALRVQRPNVPPGASRGRRGERGMAIPAPLALGCQDGD